MQESFRLHALLKCAAVNVNEGLKRCHSDMPANGPDPLGMTVRVPPHPNHGEVTMTNSRPWEYGIDSERR